MRELLFGRHLLKEEMHPLVHSSMIPNLIVDSGFQEKFGNQTSCNRCGETNEKKRQVAPCVCKKTCYYCTSCLQMGKVKKCSSLFSIVEPNHFPSNQTNLLTWRGELSIQQAMASNAIKEAVALKTTHLIWAVAGAGKTEMIFAGIEEALSQGKRVCIASPRVDVCLELAPRLKSAFSHTPVAVLYGASEEKYEYTPLVIATTHQLMRFKEAFDVAIVDEIDAFPFHSDKGLHFAVNKAVKKEKTLIYLTATPTKKMQKEIASNQLRATILPARYHGYPLPEPTVHWVGDWKKHLTLNKIPKKLKHLLTKLVHKKRRFLLFVPQIDLMEKLAELIQECFPSQLFLSVYAADEKRKESVLKMREEKLTGLLTTTILERGVTFRDIDVLVLGAEDQTFTESSLVQIAGRVGRHPEFPRGEVQFLHYGQTKAMKNAIKQIKKMNQHAKKKGLLKC
ncbi:DEAD/DEAH box helicase [Carnobacterium divergens]|uniref:DEAD/DEAH box helicase n=1 Tax=Carnobacterium divergens TaxID=2748 RepID=UPI0039B089B5